jgi:hypothetical protein
MEVDSCMAEAWKLVLCLIIFKIVGLVTLDICLRINATI